MRGEVPTIRPIVPKPRGDAEWFARPRANRQSSICNRQSQAVYEYDVYGQPAAADPGHPNPFAFTGRRFDPETGLYYYRARYYNPTIGRFLQTDPARDGTNLYAYCRNNPSNSVDPMGLETWVWGYLYDGRMDELYRLWCDDDRFWNLDGVYLYFNLDPGGLHAYGLFRGSGLYYIRHDARFARQPDRIEAGRVAHVYIEEVRLRAKTDIILPLFWTSG